MERLNNVLPSNIKVLDAKQITRQDGAIDIIAQWASFTFEPLEEGILKFEDLLYIKERISSSNEIFIEKINKKGIKKLVNIKSSIKAVDVTNNKISMILKVGQSEEIPSVKPDDVIKLYSSDVIFKIKRTAFYDKDMNEL